MSVRPKHNGIMLGEKSPLIAGPKRQKRKVGRPEDDHMRGIVGPEWAAVGFTVYVTSTRRKPVGVTPGIPDLILTHPGLGLRLYHEVKLSDAHPSFSRQSQSQRQFQELTIDAGMAYVLGDVTAARDFLVFLGLGYYQPTKHSMTGEDIFMRRERSAYPAWLADRWSVRRKAEAWNESPRAVVHNQVWGWKFTPSQAVPLVNRRRRRSP